MIDINFDVTLELVSETELIILKFIKTHKN